MPPDMPPSSNVSGPTICVACRHCRGETRFMCHAPTLETREKLNFITGIPKVEIRTGIYWNEAEDGGVPCLFINQKGECPHYQPKEPS